MKTSVPFQLKQDEITVAVGHIMVGAGDQHPVHGHILSAGGENSAPFTGAITGIQIKR